MLPTGLSAANLTTTNVQPTGQDWTAQIWKTNIASTTFFSPVAGNSYACIFNGTVFGNSKNNTRIRNPAMAGVQTFPGDSLTLNTNTELRMKTAGAVLNFPGVGGTPGLILNGGVLNPGDDAVFVVTGRVQVAGQSYITPGNGGGGTMLPLRGVNIAGQLSGSGTMVVFQAGTTVAQQISGISNTFTGKWILKAGWLLGSGLGSLGTNSILVDPNYVLPLDSSIVNVPGPAWFEPGYDLNSAGTLTLTNGGIMILHQNCMFRAVRIDSASLSAGTHSYDELAANFPNNFAAGGSGSLTVQPYGPPPPFPPSIVIQPVSTSLYAGGSTQLVAAASGGAPLSYQWQKGTNDTYVNLVDGGTIAGSRANVLSLNAVTPSDSADYRLVVTNSLGRATSQVATVTVVVPDAGRPAVASLDPPAGATLNNLSQIQVTFTENVVGVAAGDLLISGVPATAVSGSGSNYVFSFSQPPPGTIPVYWDADNAITDSAGNPFDGSANWSYILSDSLPPALLATAPADGATVGRLAQAQVWFSESVTGVGASDLLVNGVPAVNAVGSGGGPYVFDFASPAPGTVQFSWTAGHNIRDRAGNLFGATGWAVLLDPPTAADALTNVLINEFLAANNSINGLRDEDFLLSDWIELYNRGSVPVNLTGWSLTDNADDPARWIFPQTQLEVGQYLVVFASGKDRCVPGANLHTSFNLSSAGAYLGLYNSEFPPQVAHQYAPAYPPQRNDISYGLDDVRQERYFAEQTPGRANSSSTLTGVVAEVHLSVPHGFFSQPFNLLLTTTNTDATIVYTTDGSVPSINAGVTNGTVYTGPVDISRTTVLRAVAFAPDLLPSLVATRTFLFVEDIARQPNNPEGYPTGNVWTPTPDIVENGSRAYYQMDPVIVDDPQYSNTVRAGLVSIPTLSLVLTIPDLFDPYTGIYTHPENRGPDWERACSMELISPDGTPGLQIDCGLQIQGGTQRQPGKNAKHALRVSFKGSYGASTLDYPFYADSPVESFNTLVLHGGINMWWHYVGGSTPVDQRYRAQCVRDQFTSDLMLALGQPANHGRFHHVYLNGLYWGLHYVGERPDDAFAASYLGGERADYDVVRKTTTVLELIAGDLDAWNATLALSNSGLTNDTQYVQLQQYVDLDNLIDYMIVQHWVGNTDWPHHNWYAIRKRSPGEGFRFIVWDAEHVLKDVTVNQTTANASGSPAQIYSSLRSNPEFKLRFADHLQKHFFGNGLFYTDANPTNAVWNDAYPERNVPASYYMKRIREIDTAIVDESARWGGYTLTTNYTRNVHWLRELNNLLGYTNNLGNTTNYFPLRSARVLNQYKGIGLFPGVSAPVFNQQGGNVPSGFALTMTNPNGAGKIYYTTNGTDPRAYGSGAVAPGARVYTNGVPLVLKSSMIVKARVLNGNWSALNEAAFSVASLGIPIRFTEIMYHPVGGDAYEFVELQNIGATTLDLGGYSLEGVTFVFPDGAALAPGGVLVLASSVNPAAFAARYPGVLVSGYYGGALANDGERITLLDRNGNTVISVDYRDSGGWPTAADGSGNSLEVLNPDDDPDDPANWQASLALNGSPGVVNPPPAVPSVRINEVMADNAGGVTNGGTWPDWVELYNSNTSGVSLANWSFSNSGNARKFVFPSGASLPGRGYLLLWCDSDTNAPGLHSGFALGRKGESLFLYDAATNRVDAFSFGLQLTNYTVGRIGSDAAWQLTSPTPGSNNVAASVGGTTNLILNEWLANAAPGDSDWVEIFNKSPDLPVALSGTYFVTSNDVFQIRSLSFIGPRGFVQLFADKNPGPDHLDFKLSAAGDTLTLFDRAGQLLDTVVFAAQSEGISRGRLPDGSGNFVDFPGSASPGASNYVRSYTGPILNEVMARNVSAVYDPWGNNPDWLELYNAASTNCSLAGMSLSRNSGSPARWIFPADASVPANGFLVVWCDPSRAASTNASMPLNTGFVLDGDGDTVYLLDVNSRIADSVAFGPQVADMSIGRRAGLWGLLNSPTLGGSNAPNAILGSPTGLKINEWMAAPGDGDDWFELYNTDARPVALDGLWLTDDPSVCGLTNFQVATLSFVAGHGWVKFEADGQPGRGPNHATFRLDRFGQTLRLYNTDLAMIDGVDFSFQAAGVSQGRLPDGGDTVVAFPASPTPAASNYLPLQNVVVNEVLSHTDPPLEDAVELYNPGPTNVALGGWFLSNSEADFKKYRIPGGTTLAARGYRVFYEYQFNGTNAVPFTLNSAHGDRVLVSEADGAGNLTGRRAQVAFPAAGNGVSFGRFVTSVGEDFAPLARRTFGADNPSTLSQFRTGTGLTNSYPRVGPVVINEIMFHPVTLSGTNLSENADEEFIELFNISSNTVPLYDPAASTNTWKLAGGLDFTFPGGVSLPPGGFLLVVGFDPVANPAALVNFRLKYGLTPDVTLYGPWQGRLNNAGEQLELLKPDSPQAAPRPDAGFVPYLLVEQVTYGPAAPWPPGPDGGGFSLQRRVLGSYANDPPNWSACSPTPGTRNCFSDTDGDGLPDDWELANGLNPFSATGNDGANGDADADGFTNFQEFLAGTNPRDAQSRLKFDGISQLGGMATLRFTRVAGHTYTIQFRNSLATGSWQKLADVEAASVTSRAEVNDPATGAMRFYRLVTPKQP